MDHPVSVECYTLPEAAEGLGRTLLTLNRWIKDDLLPGPYLRETVRKFRVYSIGELRAIARVLAQHEHEFAYFTTAHTVTRNMIHQTVHAYRVSHI
jgi:hypothetical protein